jgi:copper ion binding protein
MPLFGKPKGEQLTLNIEGMTCGHCVMHVTQALQKVKGIIKAEVDLGKKTAVVTFQTGTATREQLIKAVEDAGYKVL